MGGDKLAVNVKTANCSGLESQNSLPHSVQTKNIFVQANTGVQFAFQRTWIGRSKQMSYLVYVWTPNNEQFC